MKKNRFPGAFVHPTAEIEENVRIGAGTHIWHYVHVRRGARIGKNCSLGKNVFIDRGVTLGKGVRIQNGVSVYAGVRLADQVFVGPNVTFTNDLYPRAFPNGWKVIPTVVEKGASFGANATVLCGITIGKYAMVGAGAIASKNIPAYALIRSTPSPVVGRVTRSGHPISESHPFRKRARRRS